MKLNKGYCDILRCRQKDTCENGCREYWNMVRAVELDRERVIKIIDSHVMQGGYHITELDDDENIVMWLTLSEVRGLKNEILETVSAEESERRGREEAKKDCLEIVDHHIELADMIRGDEDYCLVTTVKGWLELIRIKMKELSYE